MKRKRNILIMLAVIIILGVISVILYSGNKEKAEEDTNLYMTETKLDDITEFSVTYNNEELLFKKDGDGWTYPADKSFPVNNDFVDKLTEKFKKLYANRIVEGNNVDDASFGLSSPACVISATDVNGATVTYNVGELNTSLNRYYFKADGNDSIYLVSATYAEPFFISLGDAVGKFDLSKLKASNATKVTLKSEDSTVSVRRLDEEDTLKTIYSDKYTWCFESPYENTVPVDSNKISAIITKLSKPEYTMASYAPTAEELKTYGFDEVNKSVSIDYSYTYYKEKYDKTATLLIGKPDGNGNVYAAFEGFSPVYTVTEAEISSINNYFDPMLFVPAKVCVIDINTVDSMEITTESSSYTVQINRDSDVIKYLINGKEMNSNAFETFYKKLTAVSRENVSDESFEDYNRLTVVFNRNTENFKTMQLSFYEYDNNFSRVSFNGMDNLLVNRKTVDSLIKSIEELAQ